MAFVPVSWQYRDVFTSAKAAQMEENVRVHDHVSTGQGANLRTKAVATGRTLVGAGVSTAADTAVEHSVSFPAGRFSSAPRVVAIAETTVGTRRTTTARAATASGCVLRFYTGAAGLSTAGVYVQWIAIEQ